MPHEIDVDPQIFELQHYLTVHAERVCVLGTQAFFALSVMVTVIHLLTVEDNSQALTISLLLVTLLVVFRIPQILNLTIKMLKANCTEDCRNESLPVEVLWLPGMLLSLIAADLTILPAMLHHVGYKWGSLVGMVVPLLLAALICWLPLLTGQAAKLEIEAKE